MVKSVNIVPKTIKINNVMIIIIHYTMFLFNLSML